MVVLIIYDIMSEFNLLIDHY